jgi:hypothetical protein
LQWGVVDPGGPRTSLSIDHHQRLSEKYNNPPIKLLFMPATTQSGQAKEDRNQHDMHVNSLSVDFMMSGADC